MKDRTDAGRFSLRDLGPLLGFEALYKMAAVVLFVPLLAGAFSLAMHLKGYAYLTHENIGAFLTDPLTILLLAVLLVLAAAYAVTDIGAVAFAADQAVRGVRAGPEQILRFALKNTARLRRPGDMLMGLMAMLLIPLVSIGLGAAFLEAVTIPAAFVRFVRARPYLPPLAGAVVLLSTALGLRWRYAVFIFTVEGCRFAEARRRAAALAEGGRF